jgi:hypothetical protein
MSNNKKNKPSQPSYDLAILCQFQNEGERLQTWLQHYIWQGVQHFFLIDVDDNSNDNSKEVLQEFIDNGVVTHFTRSGTKVDNYRWAFDKIKRKTNWLAVCDINDFFYGVNKKLSTVLKRISPEVNMVICNEFCYEGLYNSDPRCSILHRDIILSKNTKYIFRVRSVSHSSQLWLQCLLYPKSKKMLIKHPTTFLTNTVIRLHHYVNRNENHNDNDSENKTIQYLCDTTLKDLVEKTPSDY